MAKKERKKLGKFFGEFKEFASRGNVIDLAVGVIIGGAFGTITTSLVNDIIMPFASMFLGGVDFSQWKITLPQLFGTPAADAVPITINYGNLISVIINFIILAFCVFLLVKGINRLRATNAKDEAPAPEPAPPEPTKEELLLTEIRDLLKEKK